MFVFRIISSVLMAVLIMYAVHRYILVFLWARYCRRKHDRRDPAIWPTVLIQLPVFNESSVVKRLVEGALELDYPRDRIQFQLLDDSTDETVSVAAAIVAQARAQGYNIAHVHRTDRKGFKAGALKEGLLVSQSELVAVFDADFVPRRNFLRELVPYFVNAKAGMVQATWEHFNCRASLLTRLQEVITVSHFALDQRARSSSGRFFNFNGTCGIWRRKCIADAGGWEGDTLAEDMDLSYRAQLRGWEFIYIDKVLADAELPADMNTFKRQQERWTKGTIQVAVKLLVPVLTSRQPFKVKLEAFFHLTNTVVYPIGLISSLCVLPSLYWLIFVPGQEKVWDAAFFIGLSMVAFFYHMFGQYVRHGKKAWRYIPDAFVAVTVAMGLSAHLSVAFFKGLFEKKVFFVRTPKTGKACAGVPVLNRPAMEPWTRADVVVMAELALCAYFLWSGCFAFYYGYEGNSLFLFVFALGFAYVGALSGWERLTSRLHFARK